MAIAVPSRGVGTGFFRERLELETFFPWSAFHHDDGYIKGGAAR